MKDAKIFVDTNILIYGYDISAGEKYTTAKKILKDLWNTSNGLISTQVLQEFFVTVTRKIAKPMDVMTAILSEDLSDTQKIKGIVIKNPFS
jgi:predicted nucleic acid-binding protein